MKLVANQDVVTVSHGKLTKGQVLICPDDIALQLIEEHPRVFSLWTGTDSGQFQEEPSPPEAA